MTKELLENLLIEFDEMGYEPTTLCDTQKEIESFRNRLKQVLDYLKSIDNANPSEALKCLDDIYRNGVFISDYDALGKQHPTNISPETNKSISEQCETIKQALLELKAIKEANPSEALEKLKTIKIKCHPNSNPSPLVDEALEVVEQALIKAQEQEKVIIELCEYCGMDNLYPYDNLEEIKITFKDTFDNYQLQRITSLGRLNKLENENTELKRVLEIIFKKTVSIFQLSCCKNVYEYNDLKFNDNEKLTEEELEVLKRYLNDK